MRLDETGPFMGSMVQETVKNRFGMLACVVGHRIYRVLNVAHFHHRYHKHKLRAVWLHDVFSNVRSVEVVKENVT